MIAILDRKLRHPGAARIALLLCGFIFSLVLSARSQNSTAGSQAAQPARDLSGVWISPRGASERSSSSGAAHAGPRSRSLTREEPSMTPWAMEIWKRNREGIKNTNENGRIDRDPSQWCYPLGPSRIVSNNEPFEIRQSPDQIILFFERDHSVRRINMDEPEHPDGYPITWMGHSIGKWDGDTLVVETVFINPDTWVDALGHPQSDEMRLIERIHRVNQKTLQIDTTFNDPKAYTKPWTEKETFELMPPGYELLEHTECEEWMAVEKPRRPERPPQEMRDIYDFSHPVTLTGTVTEYDYSSPRVRIHFDVKDKNGTASKWTVETASPLKIYRAGWKKDSLKPGDVITVTGLPAKDGSKLLSLRKLTALGGKTLTEGPG
jgi:uncharacterized protein DUF6152